MNKGDVGGVVNCPAPFSGKAPPRAEPRSHLNHLFDETYMLKAKCAKDFQLADTDGSGFLTESEFCNLLRDPRVKVWLKELDVELFDAARLFSLLDYNDGGTLSSHEFIEGCLRARGEAKAKVYTPLLCMVYIINSLKQPETV